MVMYGCESWTVKKTERQRIDAFELWCWRRLLRVSWTARLPLLAGLPSGGAQAAGAIVGVQAAHPFGFARLS